MAQFLEGLGFRLKIVEFLGRAELLSSRVGISPFVRLSLGGAGWCAAGWSFRLLSAGLYGELYVENGQSCVSVSHRSELA